MRNARGFTVAELITVVVIIGIIASIALPVASYGLRREREIELREHLRKIHYAIDLYHDLADPRSTSPVKLAQMQALGSAGYPKDLKDLVKGVKLTTGKSIKLLRERDLIDPMTGKTDWITLSTNDDPDASGSRGDSGDNIFEVHSASTAVSLDGKSHYNEW